MTIPETEPHARTLVVLIDRRTGAARRFEDRACMHEVLYSTLALALWNADLCRLPCGFSADAFVFTVSNATEAVGIVETHLRRVKQIDFATIADFDGTSWWISRTARRRAGRFRWCPWNWFRKSPHRDDLHARLARALAVVEEQTRGQADTYLQGLIAGKPGDS